MYELNITKIEKYVNTYLFYVYLCKVILENYIIIISVIVGKHIKNIFTIIIGVRIILYTYYRV